jgi:hypothetical protein
MGQILKSAPSQPSRPASFPAHAAQLEAQPLQPSLAHCLSCPYRTPTQISTRDKAANPIGLESNPVACSSSGISPLLDSNLKIVRWLPLGDRISRSPPRLRVGTEIPIYRPRFCSNLHPLIQDSMALGDLAPCTWSMVP